MKKTVVAVVCMSLVSLTACQPQNTVQESASVAEVASGEVASMSAQEGESGFNGSSFLMGALAAQALNGLRGKSKQTQTQPVPENKTNVGNTATPSNGSSTSSPSKGSSELRFRDDPPAKTNQAATTNTAPTKSSVFGTQNRSGFKSTRGRRR